MTVELNRGTRTAVVGRHSVVNEVMVNFVKKNEHATSGSNKAGANISRRLWLDATLE